MTSSKHLGLALLATADYATTLRRDYIAAMSGPEETSNLQKIDSAIGDLRTLLKDIENSLSDI